MFLPPAFLQSAAQGLLKPRTSSQRTCKSHSSLRGMLHFNLRHRSPARGQELNSPERWSFLLPERHWWGTSGKPEVLEAPLLPVTKEPHCTKLLARHTHTPECSSFLILLIRSYPSISGHWIKIRTSVKKKKKKRPNNKEISHAASRRNMLGKRKRVAGAVCNFVSLCFTSQICWISVSTG